MFASAGGGAMNAGAAGGADVAGVGAGTGTGLAVAWTGAMASGCAVTVSTASCLAVTVVWEAGLFAFARVVMVEGSLSACGVRSLRMDPPALHPDAPGCT